jgi:hypothetical protein
MFNDINTPGPQLGDAPFERQPNFGEKGNDLIEGFYHDTDIVHSY